MPPCGSGRGILLPNDELNLSDIQRCTCKRVIIGSTTQLNGA
jgi:hypothetical protein